MYQIGATNNNNNGNTPTPYHADNFSTDLKNWWHNCPLFSRFLIFICTALSVLGLIGGSDLLPVNIPKLTIGEYQIPRLIFSPFAFLTLAELLFGFIAYLPITAIEEKERGTLKTTIEFFVKNLQINLTFLSICYFLSLISNSFLEYSAHGLWCIFFAQIVEKVLENPEGNSTIMCLPIHIKSKFYPIILFVVFTIISHEFRLDLISAAIIGFINGRFGHIIFDGYLHDERITAWEGASALAWFKGLNSYVAHGSMSGPLINDQDAINPNYPPIGDFNNTGAAKQESYDLYGGNGIEIGGEMNNGYKANKQGQDKTGFEGLEL